MSEADTAAQRDPRRQEEIAALTRAMATGMDAEKFMRGDLGRFFQLKASRELEEAQEALLEVNLASEEGRARAGELQMQGRVAARVLTWFADAVQEGRNAETQFAQTYDESQGD